MQRKSFPFVSHRVMPNSEAARPGPIKVDSGSTRELGCMSHKQNDLIDGDVLSNRRRRAFLATGLGMAAAALLLPVGASDASAAHAQETGRSAGQSPSPGGAGGAPEAKPAATKAEQEVIALSKKKWDWMSERKVDSLDALFHEKAVFVHMGGSMSKKQELDTIRGGGIQYKKAEIREVSARIIDSTAIVLSTIRLLAVVGGNEVTNPFVVTEVFVQQSGTWKLASLSFTRTFG